MPVETAFAELEEVLRAWLPAVPRAADRLLAATGPRLFEPATLLPGYLAMPRLSVRWRVRGVFEGENTRFLLWSRNAAAREMIDAELDLQLRPCAKDELPASPKPVGHATVRFPGLVQRGHSAEEFRARAPDGADPAHTLILQLAPEQTLACWDPVPASSTDLASRIRARWVHGGIVRDLGPRGPWPIELFVSLARALGSTGAAGAPADEPLTILGRNLPVWQFALAGLNVAATAPGWLAPSTEPFPHPQLEALRSNWTVESCSLRAGVLVAPGGRLAAWHMDDTFLAPFRVAWKAADPGACLALELEPPDVVARDGLRKALLDAFRERLDFEAVVHDLNDAVPGVNLHASTVEGWSDPDQDLSVILRTDRKEQGADEEHLLVMEGEAGGVPVVVLVNAAHVALGLSDGEWRARVTGLDLLHAGPVRDLDLRWAVGLIPRARAQLLGDILAILMRWRGLFT